MAISSTKKPKSNLFSSMAASSPFASRKNPKIPPRAISPASGSSPTPLRKDRRNRPSTFPWPVTARSPAPSAARAATPPSSAAISASINSASPSIFPSRVRPPMSFSTAPSTALPSKAPSACKAWKSTLPAQSPAAIAATSLTEVLSESRSNEPPDLLLLTLCTLRRASRTLLIRIDPSRRRGVLFRHPHPERHPPHRQSRHHRARLHPHQRRKNRRSGRQPESPQGRAGD